MSNLLKFLMLMAFCPRIDDDEPPPDLDDDDPPAGDDDDPPDDDDESIDDDDPPAKPVSRSQKEIISLRERAQKAEDDHRRAVAELDAARRTPAAQQQPTTEQSLWQQEEVALKDPNCESWQRYAINSARDARAARAESQNAMRQSKDMIDKSEFDRIATTRPKTHAAYKDKVETMLTEIRKNGGDAPRKELLALCIGRDSLEGKLKTETKAAKPGGVKRGSTPGARSDVRTSSGGGQSAYEKALKRLEGKRI